VLFFLSLAALEIAHGVSRLDAVRERSRAELLDTTIGRAQADLAAELVDHFEGQREHAAYLASLPALRRTLSPAAPRDAAISDGAPDDSARRELESQFLAHLLSFRTLDRIRVLDLGGRERARCERIGPAGGVGALPPARLGLERDEALLSLARALAPGEIRRTGLVVDADRVEMPPSERQVFHYLAGIGSAPPDGTKADGARPSQRLGALVLTVYAAPLLEAVRDFAPIDGIGSFLIDPTGRYLAHSERYRERPGGAGFAEEHPGAARAILAGAARATEGRIHFLARAAGEDTGWIFVLRVPESALDAASGGLREEYAAIVATVLAVTLLLAAATIFFVRLGARAVRLEEQRRQAELEERLRIAERLGALGLIAAGVAHEINNPLEGIGNYLALLEKESIPPEKRREHLAHVRHGFARIRDIVRDLSNVSRPSPGDGVAEIARVIERALRLARYDHRFREVEVAVECDGALRVSGDEGRLEQVLLNLLLNAGRAMRGRGRVEVGARRLEGADARWIEISIADSGPGIDPALLERLFEPFFTTAAGQEGTGLGLAISRGIVVAHGGTIAAENRPAGGARFVVRLPARDADEPLPPRGTA